MQIWNLRFLNSYAKERPRKLPKMYDFYFIIQFVNHKNDFYKMLPIFVALWGSTKYEFLWCNTIIYKFVFFLIVLPLFSFFEVVHRSVTLKLYLFLQRARFQNFVTFPTWHPTQTPIGCNYTVTIEAKNLSTAMCRVFDIFIIY